MRTAGVVKPQLVLDEFGQKLLEELDYKMEMRNIQVSETQLKRGTAYAKANTKPWRC
jgi:predicted unusual protein kinase regulating ubiquinone biosynthesis (AarF/ABC1/UbiB family)